MGKYIFLPKDLKETIKKKTLVNLKGQSNEIFEPAWTTDQIFSILFKILMILIMALGV